MLISVLHSEGESSSYINLTNYLIIKMQQNPKWDFARDAQQVDMKLLLAKVEWREG